MAALVSLHNSLSAAASEAQQAAGMVISKESAIAVNHRAQRAESASTPTGEEKKPKVKRTAKAMTAAEKRQRTASAPHPLQQSGFRPDPSTLQYMTGQYQLPQHHHQLSSSHPSHPDQSQYAYANNPYSSLPSPHSPDGSPLYPHSQGAPNGDIMVDARRFRPPPPTGFAAQQQQYYSLPIGYSPAPSHPLDATTPQPTTPGSGSPSRITLPPISQLLPSPFGRPQNGGQSANSEEAAYYAGAALNAEQMVETGYVSPTYSVQSSQPGPNYPPLPPSSYYGGQYGHEQQQQQHQQYQGGREESVEGGGHRYSIPPYPIRPESASSDHRELSHPSTDVDPQQSNYSHMLPSSIPFANGPYANGKQWPIPPHYLPPHPNSSATGAPPMEEGFSYAQTPRLYNAPGREPSERQYLPPHPVYQATQQQQHSPVYGSLPPPHSSFDSYQLQQSKRDYVPPRQGAQEDWGYSPYDPSNRGGVSELGGPVDLPRAEDGAQIVDGRKRSRDEDNIDEQGREQKPFIGANTLNEVAGRV